MLKRKLGFESLESRRVCAGNVLVEVVDQELRITGDIGANYVDVQQKNIGGTVKWVVTGKAFGGNFNPAGDPILGGAATTINGESTPFRGTAQSVVISTNGGNDAVIVGGNGLAINTRGLTVDTGSLNDYARINNVRVTAITQTVFEMTEHSGLSANGQREAGKDKLVIDGLFLNQGSVVATTGGGADRIVANNVRGANTNVFVYAGNGADTLSVTNGTFLKVGVFMGSTAERDTVTVRATRSKEVQVDLGAGNNDLLNLVSNVTVTTKTTLNGGAGLGDTLRVGPNVQAAGRNITGFENKPVGL